MRVLKGVIHSVDKGEVVVTLDNGMKVRHPNEGDFKYAERVIAWFNWHRLKIVKLSRPEELKAMLVEKAEEPEYDPDETTVELEESDSDGSSPLRVGEGIPDVESDSDSEGSFQFFDGEFGVFPDELD